LEHVILLDEITDDKRDALVKKGLKLYNYIDIVKAGEKNIHPLPEIDPKHVFTFSYTSGTTGKNLFYNKNF
jgi:long-chain acyl-CoA synthetase